MILEVLLASGNTITACHSHKTCDLQPPETALIAGFREREDNHYIMIKVTGSSSYTDNHTR